MEAKRLGEVRCIHRIKICLHYRSDPGCQQGIGQELGVDQAAVSQTVNAVVDSIIVH